MCTMVFVLVSKKTVPNTLWKKKVYGNLFMLYLQEYTWTTKQTSHHNLDQFSIELLDHTALKHTTTSSPPSTLTWFHTIFFNHKLIVHCFLQRPQQHEIWPCIVSCCQSNCMIEILSYQMQTLAKRRTFFTAASTPHHYSSLLFRWTACSFAAWQL